MVFPVFKMSDVEVEVDPHEIQQQGRPLSPLQQEINVEQRLISHLEIQIPQ